MKQKQKVILLEVKFGSTINGVIKETAHDGKMALLMFKTPAVQPEKLSEGEPIDIQKGSCCDKKDVAVPEEMIPVKKIYIKGILSDISHH